MSEVVDKVLKKDLEIIIDIIRREFPDIKSIVLTGGFGRGEGAVYFYIDKYVALNDYDLVIIGENEIDLGKLNEVRNNLKKQFFPVLIDLSFILEENLKNLPLTIFSYELKYGSKVVWGNTSIFEELPEYSPDEIDLIEGTYLFLNRAGGLIWGLINYVEDKTEVYHESKLNFLIYQCIKAILAIGDAELLFQGKYHYSIAERKRLIDYVRFSYEDDYIKSLYKRAVEFKLKPDFKEYYNKNLIQLWFEIKKLHQKFFLDYERRRIRKNFDLEEYPDLFMHRISIFDIKEFIINFYRNIKIFGGKSISLAFYKSKDRVFSSIPFVLYSIEYGNKIILKNKTYLIKAGKLLGAKVDKLDLRSWFEIGKKLIFLWYGSKL